MHIIKFTKLVNLTVLLIVKKEQFQTYILSNKDLLFLKTIIRAIKLNRLIDRKWKGGGILMNS